jgi:signal recognition particle receptor subunit beta
MVELNHRDRLIKVKLVYYGPPVGGKTTNLHILHRAADVHRRGEMVSINSAQDRTILFDLLPLKTPGYRGFELRLQVLAVPGQAMYATTRRLVLKGADSLVFVANSALDRWDENIQSYREMTQNLLSHHLDPDAMPLVFQYNKRDLPQVLEAAALDRALNARHAETIPAVAIRGEGVLETFTAILAQTVQNLSTRYAILDISQGTPARQWAEEAVVQLFGAKQLRLEPPSAPAPRPSGSSAAAASPPAARVSSDAVPPAPAPATTPAAPAAGPAGAEPPDERAFRPPGYTVIRASPTPGADDSARSHASAEARSSELVETYAEASAQLGSALDDLREERDAARQRLVDLRQTMRAAQDVLAGAPLDVAVKPVLETMARIARTERAAFWVPEPGRPPRVAALLGLAEEPLLGRPAALRHVFEVATRGAAPAFAHASDDAELREALVTAPGPFASVLAAAFRTPGGVQGIAIFYYGPDTARPGVSALEHLGEIPRALAVALELMATLQTTRAAERALELALAGSASLRGLEGVVRSLEELRERLGQMRGRHDAPPWFLEQYLRLAPALSSALEDGRSLLAFSRGEIRKEAVYVEDLLAELHTPDVAVEIDPAAELVSGDATLLRVALRAVTDEVRTRAGSHTTPLAIRAGAWTDGVRIAVRSTGDSAPLAPAEARPAAARLSLSLARRIAEMHGGTLEDRRTEAAGEIVLTLPAA